MPTIEEQRDALIQILERSLTDREPAATMALWQIYVALTGGSSGVISPGATEATLQAILAKIPSHSTPNTTTGSRVTTAGTIAAGSRHLYLEVILGPVIVGGLQFPTDKVLNLENPGPGGLGAIAYDATGGELEIWETR